ncbi:MAG TPA: hypothetical protein VJC21_03945 [Candidatus Nanoarchaeia archaeon]|nr:hypothetical protein [Candidatus Nanoarchaeia archaeon]
MHDLIKSGNWEVETIRDDSDTDPQTTIEERLRGCSFMELTRENKRYIATLRVEEKEHDAFFQVEADVLLNRGDAFEYTGQQLHYFRRLLIEGESARGEAAKAAKKYQDEIDEIFRKTERSPS